MKSGFYYNSLIKVLLIIYVSVFFVFSAIHLRANASKYQHFLYLSQGFLQGNLYIEDIPQDSELDWVFYDNKYYLHLFPFPAVLLSPFVLVFGSVINQSHLVFILTAVNFFIAYKVASKYLKSEVKSVLLAFALIFSSVYIYIAFNPWSWYLSHAVSLFLGLLALYLWLINKRPLYIGLLCGLMFLTRPISAFLIVFFIIDYAKKFDFKRLLELFSPFLLFVFLYLLYNFSRFGSFFTTGYEFVNLNLLDVTSNYELINHGVFKISNIPSNFYYFFLSGPSPVYLNAETYILTFPYISNNVDSISFFLISPIFLRLFYTNFKKKQNIVLALLSIFMILILLSYYYNGASQLGPRYMIDAFPVLFLLLLDSFEKYKFGFGTILLILLSSIFNLYLLLTLPA